MIAAPDDGYWRDQIRHPVRFRQSIEAATLTAGTFLEIGPGATLITLGRRCVSEGGVWLSSLTEPDQDWSSIFAALGALYRQGRTIRWQMVEADGGRRVGLPTYPFEHERFWVEPYRSDPPAARNTVPPHPERPHPLLGETLGGEGVGFEALLGLDRLPFLSDHRVFGHTVLPTAAILDAVIAAAECSGFSQPMIQDFVYERALTIPSDEPLWTETSIDSRAESTSFRLQSTGMEPDGSWHLNASGTVHGGPGPLPPALPGHRMRAGHEIAPDRFYRFLDRVGLSYGAAFRGIRRLWQDHDQVFAEVALPAGLDTASYQIHPAFLDACLHVYPALIQRYEQFDGVPSAEVGVYVPITIDAFHLYEPKVERAWVHGIVVDREADEAQLKLDIRAYGEDGRPIAVLRGLTVRRVVNEMSVPAEEAGFGALLYTLDWREIPDPAPAPRSPRHWYIIADQTGVGERLGHLLAAQGASAVVQTSDLPVIDRTLDEAPECAVGLVYLRALDAPPTDLAGLAPASQTNALVCGGCLDLAKALDRMRDRFRDPPRLWLVTRGAENALAQTPLWGLGRSFALEYPEMWGGLIDLPAEAASGIAADLLLRELQAGDGEDQISYRAGKRLAPRLVRLASSGGTAPNLAAEATYWIVGGLGRLGLQTAAALIEAGAQHLVLTGRSEPGFCWQRCDRAAAAECRSAVPPSGCRRPSSG